MLVEALIERLKKASRDRHGWKACCPAHEDHTPSLSVSEGTGGKILLKCWAGCPTDRVVAALGLTMADLMGDANQEAARDGGRGRSADGERKRGKIVATYDYQDSAGKVLFQVCRMDPKAFSQRVPDGEKPGAWKWGRSRYGVSEVIYRLPRVLSACSARKVVLVVEGEKDVQAWEKLGITATCNPGGAGKWRREFSQYFKGAARVVVIADNDPAPQGGKEGWQGQHHADDTRRMLELDGVPVTTLLLPAIGGVEVKDSSDWLAAGGSLELLRDAIKSAPPWPPTFLAIEKVGVSTTANAAGAGKGKAGGIAAKIKVDQADTLAKNISHNLYEASKDVDGKTRNLGTNERREIIAQTVLRWLLGRGKFFFHADLRDYSQNMFFDGSVNELMLIESDRFQSWIALESGQNRTNRDYGYFHASVHDAALCGEHSKGILPENYWARRGNVIYMSQGDGLMVRITADKIEQVPNGTDDVLFSVGKTLAPWNLLAEGEERDPFDVCRLFREMACVSPCGQMLVRLWMLGLAACHTCKPPLVLAGGIGSGKTRSAVGIFELFGMVPRISSVAENGEENFWTSLDQGGLVCFDNADTRVKWLSDAMAAASTDGTHEKRRMYSDSDLIQQRARAWAMVTSANATFAADAGLADRLIVVRLDRRTKETAESSLTTEIAAHRNACLSWICRTLGKALSDTAPTPGTINRRHPDWASFAVRCGRAIGKEAEAVESLQEAESDKSRFSVENDAIGSMLLQVMGFQDSFSGTVTDLVAVLESRVDGFDRHMWSPIKIGRRLEKIWPHLEAVFGAKKRIIHGKTLYDMVGVVGVEGRFGISSGKTVLHTNTQIASQLPPLPPQNKDEWQGDEEEFVFGGFGE